MVQSIDRYPGAVVEVNAPDDKVKVKFDHHPKDKYDKWSVLSFLLSVSLVCERLMPPLNRGPSCLNFFVGPGNP